MFPPREQKRLVPAFIHLQPPLNYLIPMCQSSSNLHSSPSAPKQPPSHTFAHLLGSCHVDSKGHDWISCCRKEEKGREEIRKKTRSSYVKHDCNLAIQIAFTARKAVPHLWGKVLGQTAARCSVLSWAAMGMYRQPQVSEHKQGDATRVF